MQGTIGYAVIAVGALLAVFATPRAERAATGNDGMDVALRKLRPAIAVVAAAVAVYLGLRSQHEGVLGIRIATVILVANAFAVGLLKARIAKRLLDGETRKRFTLYAELEALGFALVFAGIYVYLTR